MSYMTLAGLILISAGWLIQYYAMKGKEKSIQKNFVLVNCLGILILIIDGYLAGQTYMAAGNALTLVASAAVFLKIK